MFYGCIPPPNLHHHDPTSEGWCEDIGEMVEVMSTVSNEHSTVLLELSGITAEDSRIAGRCYPCDEGCLDMVSSIDLTKYDQVTTLLALVSTAVPWLIVMYDTNDEHIAQVQMLLCQQQVDNKRKQQRGKGAALPNPCLNAKALM